MFDDDDATFLEFLGLGIDGRDDMKPICGIRIAGMRLRTRKADKVSLLQSFTYEPLSHSRTILYRPY